MIVHEREKGRRVDFKKMQGFFWKILLGGWKWTAGWFWQNLRGFLKISLSERDGRRVLFREKSRFFFVIDIVVVVN